MKIEEKEDNFHRNLEEFKSPGFEKTPLVCSMSRTAADLNYKSYDMQSEQIYGDIN